MIFTATVFIYHLDFCSKSCLFSLHLPPLPSFLLFKLKSWLSCIDPSSAQSPPEEKPKTSYRLTNSCDRRGHALPPSPPSSLTGRLAVPQHALALTLLQLYPRDLPGSPHHSPKISAPTSFLTEDFPDHSI